MEADDSPARPRGIDMQSLRVFKLPVSEAEVPLRFLTRIRSARWHPAGLRGEIQERPHRLDRPDISWILPRLRRRSALDPSGHPSISTSASQFTGAFKGMAMPIDERA